MTLYWWTHWFWITTLTVLCITDEISFVGTHPINPPYGNKEYSKEKPLEFPLAAQTDIDDVFINGEEILSAVFRDSKPIRQKDTTPRNSNVKISEHVVMAQSSALGEVKTPLNTNNKTLSETLDKLNRTKAVDVNLVNNSSLVSTQSSLEIDSSETEAVDLSDTTIDADIQQHTSNNSSSVDYDNIISSESLDDSRNHTTSSIMTIAVLKTNKNPFIKSLNLENLTKGEEIVQREVVRQLDNERGRKSKVLTEYRQELKFNFSSDAKNLLARSAAISLDDFNQEQDDGNISSEALSIQRAYILDAGAISGICFAVVGLFCGVILAGVMLYRRRYLNKPQALSEPDSSGYIDDSTIRDNSDEMYSLDNDSFLNSLEAMTIQNYWTDTVKHTKL